MFESAMQHKDLRFRTGFYPGSFPKRLRTIEPQIISRFELGLFAPRRIHLDDKWLGERMIRNIGPNIADSHFAGHFSGQ
jgi:hypothetical protein